MQDWGWLAVVLLAVLVGAAIPVLVQLFRTLGSIRKATERVTPRLERTLADLERLTARTDRVVESLEGKVDGVADTLEAAAGLAEPLRKLRGSVVSAATLGSAVAPVAVEAMRTLFDRRANPSSRARDDAEDEDPPRRGDASNEP